jgi:hypothetical protein
MTRTRRCAGFACAALAVACAAVAAAAGTAGAHQHPAAGPGQAPGHAPSWTTLEPGLDLGQFEAPQEAGVGDSIIRVLRIDPARFEFRLLNASAPGQGERRSAREWSRRNGLTAAINAGMYQQDHSTGVSLQRSRAHTNNPRVSKDKTILAFDPLDDNMPPVQIIDRECQDFEALKDRYGTLVQNIRMISCTGKNVWTQQPSRWSTAALGFDARGRILFIHVRSPYSVHDLIENLLALPLDLKGAMYLEGGPEAQLYVRSGERELEFLGSHGTLSRDDDDTPRARPIPNVIGIARREAARPAAPRPSPRPR